MNKYDRLIFHIDVNSAFLSWEATRRVGMGEEDIRNIPAVIGGNPKTRTGIVLTKSIPAKQYGINTGEPLMMAISKCPTLVIVEPDFRLYKECSKAFKDICREYTPAMESFSIDEVFLDMSGMGKLYPDPVKTAYEIKDRIRNELGFTVNVGIGENKLCAKMASDFEKPDKVHTLFMDEIADKMWPLSVRDLFMCGKATAGKLEGIGIRTIGELAAMDISLLSRIFGEKMALNLHNSSNGIDDDPVKDVPDEAKGYSVESTVEDDLDSLDKIDRMLLGQADVVAARMRKDQVKCRCVAVIMRGLDFKNKSHQRKLLQSTDVTEEIFWVAKELIRESWSGDPLRLIGLALTDVDKDGFEQMSFFVDEDRQKHRKLDNVLDNIRNKYGNASIKRASTMDVDAKIGKKFK